MTFGRLAAVLAAAAAVASPTASAAGDGPIQDNSFLLEEAYNQEPGVIQHISDVTGEEGRLTTLATGASLVWLAHTKLNVLVEALYTSTEIALPGGSLRDETFTINPGVRGAIDFANGLQIVPGLAMPLGVGPSRGDRALFLYLSLEHPRRWAGPTVEKP